MMTPLYKILSLGLSYPEPEKWAVMEKQFELCLDRYKGILLTRLDSFKTCFCESKHRINELQSEYLRVFDVGRVVSPYETEHITEKASRKPFELADIGGFYSAFGFGINHDKQFKEALDHISVELEFMAILTWKEAYAILNEQGNHAAIVEDATLKFFKDHLAVWGFYFCRRISEVHCDDFYKNIAMLLEGMMIQECRRFSLDISLFDRPLKHDQYKGVRDEQLTCGP